MKTSMVKKNILSLAVSSLALTACVTSPPLQGATQFSLGKNASGDPCTAAQNWTDPSYGENAIKFADAYSINCRGATAGTLGRVRIFENLAARKSFAENLSCGASKSIMLEGFEDTTARRCNDPGLGFISVVVDTKRDDAYFQASSAPNAIGAAHQATRILAGLDNPKIATSTLKPFDISEIPSATGIALIANNSNVGETLDSILSRGTTLNFRGLHSDASRYLNAAINNLDDNAPQRARAELKLEAALADSNIKFFGSADKQFAEASTIVEALDSSEQLTLRPKLRNYQGLHALNKRDFLKARTLLSSLVNGGSQSQSSLADTSTFIRLNRVNLNDRDVRTSISLSDEGVFT